MDLIRHILRLTADAEGALETDCLTTDAYKQKQVDYHVAIMRDAGLLDVDTREYKSGARHSVLGLTWAGQDYLAAVEDSTVWKRTKDTVANAVGSTTLAVIKATAEGVATAAIGKAIGL
jgi:hypothetical protein